MPSLKGKVACTFTLGNEVERKEQVNIPLSRLIEKQDVCFGNTKYGNVNNRYGRSTAQHIINPQWGVMRWSNGQDRVTEKTIWGTSLWSDKPKQLKHTGHGKIATVFAKTLVENIPERFIGNREYYFELPEKSQVTTGSESLFSVFTHMEKNWIEAKTWGDFPWNSKVRLAKLEASRQG